MNNYYGEYNKYSNIKVKVHVDNVCYKEKPKNFSVIKPRLQTNDTICEIDLLSLIHMIEKGYSISPGILKNGMTAKHWVEQTLFMIDIDNTDENVPLLSSMNALKLCEDNGILPILLYYTFNNTTDKPKFRLVFMMDEPIIDNKIREQVISTLIDLFPQSDKACKNADRIFLGTNQSVLVYDLDARINIDKVLSLSKIEIIDNRNLNDTELNTLKSNFDLLSYMSKENEVSRSTDDIVYFKTCSICGHQDCLRYYKKSNSFYCFGINGCVGGSIIDYLMITERLSLDEAIDKFKYQLCNIDRDSCIKKVDYITASELQNMDLPDVKFYVEHIIPQGLNLICSVPKLGKSWFALQLCLNLARGESFLGFDTEQCSCLYLALEDSYNRLKGRMEILLKGENAPDNLFYNINNNDINNGLIKWLEVIIKEHPEIKVIVIDTLQKVRGVSKNTNVYANDYKELGILKKFADTHNLSVNVIHHLRKGFDTGDVFDRVSGTNGITGTADTTIVLSKQNRRDENTQLSVVGRDVEYSEYTIKFDKNDCMWHMVGDTEQLKEIKVGQDYNNDTIVATIKILVEQNNGIWQGTLKELNLEHYKLYQQSYSPNEIKLKYRLDYLKPLLLLNDNIEYIAAGKVPTSEGRIQTFKINI